jgi:hypothetical protein
LAARADLLKVRGAITMAAEIRPFINRLRDTDYSKLPSPKFIRPIIVMTSQGEAASSLLGLFENWTGKIPSDAFDDIYQRIADHHGALANEARAAGIPWTGRTQTGPFESDAAYWAANLYGD